MQFFSLWQFVSFVTVSVAWTQSWIMCSLTCFCDYQLSFSFFFFFFSFFCINHVEINLFIRPITAENMYCIRETEINCLSFFLFKQNETIHSLIQCQRTHFCNCFYYVYVLSYFSLSTCTSPPTHLHLRPVTGFSQTVFSHPDITDLVTGCKYLKK